MLTDGISSELLSIRLTQSLRRGCPGPAHWRQRLRCFGRGIGDVYTSIVQICLSRASCQKGPTWPSQALTGWRPRPHRAPGSAEFCHVPDRVQVPGDPDKQAGPPRGSTALCCLQSGDNVWLQRTRCCLRKQTRRPQIPALTLWIAEFCECSMWTPEGNFKDRQLLKQLAFA